MDNSTLSAILWIVAAAILGLYLLRRKTRKLTQK